jgi:riboflavin synthase
MFTGIVEEIGTVADLADRGDGLRIRVRAPGSVRGAGRGESIAVAGVCLTVAERAPDGFEADVMAQTVRMTTLAQARPGTPVNIESATAAGGRLGGHIVQGHVDGTGEVLQVRPGGQWRVLRISLPRESAPLVVDKGSIAVDGVSLTVSAVSDAAASDPWFEVSLIPETLQATTLGTIAAGDRVNLETDVLARHVRRLLSFVPESAGPAIEGGSR